jgi:hypothetical protein
MISLHFLLDIVSATVSKAQALLADEFNDHRLASQEFPFFISPSGIRSAIDSFRHSLLKQSERSCSSCKVFCSSSETMTLQDDNSCLDEFKHVGLDRCGHQDGSWSFCNPCYTDILGDKIPKFSALNLVNVVNCHSPEALRDLTVVEECVLARRRPIGAILKLRPGNRRGPANYYALRGHMVAIPQDPGPLLDILPSPNLRFQNVIKVFWVGKCQPSTADDLKPFWEIRKEKVLAALQWLVAHNCHYRDLRINHSLLSSWPD